MPTLQSVSMHAAFFFCHLLFPFSQLFASSAHFSQKPSVLPMWTVFMHLWSFPFGLTFMRRISFVCVCVCLYVRSHFENEDNRKNTSHSKRSNRPVHEKLQTEIVILCSRSFIFNSNKKWAFQCEHISNKKWIRLMMKPDNVYEWVRERREKTSSCEHTFALFISNGKVKRWVYYL